MTTRLLGRLLPVLVAITPALAVEPLFNLLDAAGRSSLAEPFQSDGQHAIPMRESGLPFLRQPCRFVTGIHREGWDIPVMLDLRAGRGLSFDFRCRNTDPVNYFACYFKSGAGWYTAQFSAAGTGRWERIEVLKSGTILEGTPSGWARIERIRVCAWASSAQNTAFDFRAPEVIPAPAAVIIARGTVARGEADDAEPALTVRQARIADSLLAANGVKTNFMDQADLENGIPRSAHAVILPYNPILNGRVQQALLQHYERGGGVVGFYSIPDRLQDALGIRTIASVKASDVKGGFGGVALVGEGMPGAPARTLQASWIINAMQSQRADAEVRARWVNQEGELTAFPAVFACRNAAWMSHILRNDSPEEGGRLLLAMVATAWPDVWPMAIQARMDDIGRDIHPGGFHSAARWLDEVAAKKGTNRARRQVALARMARDKVVLSLKASDYPDALRQMQLAETALREAFFLIQPSVDEFRGVWCHRGYGIAGWSWDETIRRLKASGFSAIMPNIANGSEAWYPTALLEVPPRVTKGHDYLAECRSACRRYGVECHPWLVCFRLDDGVSHALLTKLEREGRLAQSASRSANRGWLCPTHPANRRQMLGVAAEILSRYSPTGLHLDYIRLPGSGYCYCPNCRSVFEQSIGQRIGEWPAAVRQNGALKDAWQDFRAGQITSFVGDVSAIRDRLRPRARISAAVYADAASARRSVAQDWPHWARQGYIDFVCPMNYTPEEAHLTQMVTRQLGRTAGGVRVYPGLGLSAKGLDGIQMVKQIGACRRAGTGGFMVFEFDRQEALGVFADLGKGMTRSGGEVLNGQ